MFGTFKAHLLKEYSNPGSDIYLLQWTIDEIINIPMGDSSFVERNKNIIKCRLFHDMSLSEIGKIHGISRERVNHICQRYYRRFRCLYRERLEVFV